LPSTGYAHSLIQVRFYLDKKKHFSKQIIINIEPIGGTMPKFVSDTKLSLYEREAMSQIALLCPAQASPVPSFR
jgi:hypothetical protein